MNERNVEALADALDRIPYHRLDPRDVAVRLVQECAALVPSALTDEECMRVHMAGNGAFTYTPAECRGALERIAKGDQP